MSYYRMIVVIDVKHQLVIEVLYEYDIWEPLAGPVVLEGQIDEEEDIDGELAPALEGRPDYDLVLDLIRAQNYKTPFGRRGSQRRKALIEETIDLETALKSLLPKNGFGQTVLDPSDAVAEEELLGEALEELHHFLTLLNAKNPPEPYTRVRQILQHRHDVLRNRLAQQADPGFDLEM